MNFKGPGTQSLLLKGQTPLPAAQTPTYLLKACEFSRTNAEITGRQQVFQYPIHACATGGIAEGCRVGLEASQGGNCLRVGPFWSSIRDEGGP